jgi:APA family basic amino acid/polyamine antiporter
MARRGDLPRSLAKVNPGSHSPYVSVAVTGVLTVLLIIFVDLTRVIAVSTFAQLFYYAAANLSAIRLGKTRKTRYRVLPVLGMASCVGLLLFVVVISPTALVIGTLGLIIGAAYYVLQKKIDKWS